MSPDRVGAGGSRPLGEGVLDLVEACRARGLGAGRPLLAVPEVGGDGNEGGAPASWAVRTLDELDARVEERARALASQVPPGRIHPFTMEPDEDGLLTLLAVWRRGATPAPLNPRLTEVERASAGAALAGRPGEGAQVVLWTSGTTGSPRGVALGFPALARHVAMVQDRLALDGDRDVWLATLSPTHVGGLMLAVRSLLTGSLLAVGGAWDPAGLAAVLRSGLPTREGSGRRITHLSLVPTQLFRLLEHWGDGPAPRGLRCLLLGGAHTPTHLLERALEAEWPVALTWGMTEMASQVATATPDEVRRKPGSVGRPLEGVQVRVEADGALRVRSPAAATALLDGTPLLDDDGWYATGDLGRMDGEGALWITGRHADRIVSGGVTVDATEVEEVIRAHPSVAGACVVGVPDDEWGERVGAWVVPVEGEFDLEELEAWLRERLAPAKRPRIWATGDRLPLNANGKVDRAEVRARLV